MADYLLDTNVLSKIFYGDAKVKKLVDGLQAGIESVVYIESIQGSISAADKAVIKRSLGQLTFYPISVEVGMLAIDLIDKYSASKGLFLVDSLIAATAITYDLDLLTYNLKHFRFIKGLKVSQPKTI